jgi:hypothetical protein
MTKPILQYNLNNELIKEWESATIAAKEINCSQAHITSCCNNKAKTHHKFIWKYKDDPDLENENWNELTNDLIGLYISNLGRCYNKYINKTYGSPDSHGYYYIQYNRKKYSIAKLVLFAFSDNEHNDNDIAYHIDGIHTNNNINNLLWKPRGYKNDNQLQQQINNSIKTRLKPIIQLQNNIELNRFNSPKEASEMLNINYKNISACASAKGDKKSAGGFQWKYVDDPNLTDEEWKTHGSGIIVSNKGRIQARHKKTYGTLNLNDNRYKFNSVFVSKLVAETFIENPDNKPTVDHIDRNRQNNCVENLRWANYTEQNLNKS